MFILRNARPTESDIEDEDEDESDQDPSTWFVDDQDDGRKDQDITEPDINERELSNIIRVDESKLTYNDDSD